MDNELVISVIVPIYNTEKYLNKCIDSILNQTYKNLQIILVDDGSTDNSGKICDEYALKDSRIQVIHKKNGGVLSARKIGVDLAIGEYIGFVDSDDYIELNMYKEMLNNLIITDADLVYASGVIYEHNNTIKVDCHFNTCIIDNPKNNVEVWKSFLRVHEKFLINPFLVDKLFKTEMIKDCLRNVPDDINFGEDRITVTEYLLKCNRLSIMQNIYYHYVQRDKGSYTSQKGATRIIWIAKMFEQVSKLLQKYGIYETVKTFFDAAFTLYILKELNTTNMIINYVFGYMDKLENKNVVIYGAGIVGYNYYLQLSRYSNCNIVDWVDKSFSYYNYNERKINPVTNLKNVNYDIIIIAAKYGEIAEQIIGELTDMGINKNKLFWCEPIKLTLS